MGRHKSTCTCSSCVEKYGDRNKNIPPPPDDMETLKPVDKNDKKTLIKIPNLGLDSEEQDKELAKEIGEKFDPKDYTGKNQDFTNITEINILTLTSLLGQADNLVNKIPGVNISKWTKKELKNLMELYEVAYPDQKSPLISPKTAFWLALGTHYSPAFVGIGKLLKDKIKKSNFSFGSIFKKGGKNESKQNPFENPNFNGIENLP